MKISKRLHAVAASVKPCGRMADIGTDHGYIPIYLYKNKIVESALACDIGEGPLAAAKKNIEAHQLTHAVEVRRSDGFSGIVAGEIDAAVISGMGGLLMLDIIQNGLAVCETVNQLVLQPQRDCYAVRKFLHQKGFAIEDEKMVWENGKFYHILSVVRGWETYEKESHYFFSKLLIEKKDAILKQFLETERIKYNKILDKIKDDKTAAYQLKMINEVLTWI